MISGKAIIISLLFLIIAAVCSITDVKKEFRLIFLGLYAMIAIFIALIA